MRSVSLPCPAGVDFGLNNREIFSPGNGSPQPAGSSAGPFSSCNNVPLGITRRRPQPGCCASSIGPAPNKIHESTTDGGGEPPVRTT